jgi:hypothetical protein
VVRTSFLLCVAAVLLLTACGSTSPDMRTDMKHLHDLIGFTPKDCTFLRDESGAHAYRCKGGIYSISADGQSGGQGIAGLP